MNLRRTLLILLAACLVPAAASAEEKKKEAKGTYVAIDTLTASVMTANGRRAVMTVQSGIDISDPALKEHADQVTPRLRAAFVQVLQAYAGGMAYGSPPDADYVARRLQQATDQVLGKPGGRLLIGGIMIN